MKKIKRIILIISNSFKAAPLLFILDVFVSLLHAFTIFGEAAVPQYFIDKMSVTKTAADILKPFIIFSLFVIVSSMLNGLANLLNDILWDFAYGYNNAELIKAASGKNPIYFEDANKLDEREKAMEGADAASFTANIYLSVFVFYIPAVVSLMLFYSSTGYFVPVVIVFTVLPTLFYKHIKEKEYDELTEHLGTLRRTEKEYRKYLMTCDFVKEIRFFDFFGILYKNWIDVTNEIISFKLLTRKKLLYKELLCQSISTVSYLLLLAYISVKTLGGQMSVGYFVAIIGSMSTISFLADEMINNNLVIAAEHLGAVNKFLSYISPYENDCNKVVEYCDDNYAVCMENVNFCYPGCEVNALKNINLKIKKGEMVAIVGENGAGKTTLSKLLLGIYQPGEGKIKYGMDINNGISVLSQNFSKYKLTCRENIEIGDIKSGLPVEPYYEKADIKKIPLETLLGKELGGIELSGGEWQRLSMARGLYRRHKFMVFDEPTASIDPNRESEIFNMIIENAKNRTTVVITHRLGLAVKADRVLVMKSGQIIGSGKHEELLRSSAYYKDLFNKQSKWYMEGAECL